MIYIQIIHSIIMSTTTIKVYTDEQYRLKYYQSVFNCGTMQDLVKTLLDKAGLASAADIKRLRQIQGEKVGTE